MSHSDSNFYKPFIFVLGALVLFTLFIVSVARMLSPASPDDPLALAEVQRSIAPVGRVRTVEPAEPVATPPAATEEAPAADAAQATEENEVAVVADAAAAPATVAGAEVTDAATATAADPATATAAIASVGSADVSMKVKATVATNCAGCHAAGLNGAQQSDDAAAWTALSAQGIDVLAASVINGKGAMPARAESSLSDDEIKQAVQLMVANATGGSMSATAAEGAATAASSTAQAAAENTETAPATAVESTDVAATATAVAAAPVAEVPAAVKQTVDSVCAACHIAGVANAPKFGDSEAWAPRIEKGIDALVASSIAGIGVMPARGGSQLDDEQMRLAVEYMLSK